MNIIFFADIIFNFCTGYVNTANGIVEMSPGYAGPTGLHLWNSWFVTVINALSEQPHRFYIFSRLVCNRYAGDVPFRHCIFGGSCVPWLMGLNVCWIFCVFCSIDFSLMLECWSCSALPALVGMQVPAARIVTVIYPHSRLFFAEQLNSRFDVSLHNLGVVYIVAFSAFLLHVAACAMSVLYEHDVRFIDHVLY